MMTRGSLAIKPWTHRHLRLSDSASVDRRCKELIERVQKHKILQTLDEADEACCVYNDKLRLSGLLDMADLHIHVFTASFPTSSMWRYSVTPSSFPKQLTKENLEDPRIPSQDVGWFTSAVLGGGFLVTNL